jgi:DNA processing protein
VPDQTTPMREQDNIDRLRLARAEGVGPVTYRRLLTRVDAAAALRSLPRLDRAGAKANPPAVPTQADVICELNRAAKLGARLVFLGDVDYPTLLTWRYDAPPVIAVQGNATLLALRAIALVVGRNVSVVNSRRIAEELDAELARAGLVVVSGMARGIDAAAHEGALSVGNPLGRTIAVVAGGRDVAYPPERADLQRRIIATGAVVSEAPRDTAPQASHFPRRNRVIAGLTLGVVVVEASPRSGSLITARLAVEAGREVFTVLGSPLDSHARGDNDLIRQGATLIETAADVLASLPDHSAAEIAPLFAPPDTPIAAAGSSEPHPLDVDLRDSTLDHTALYAQVLDLLGPSRTPVDAVPRRCQFSAPAVMAASLELELAGRSETLPGGRVAALSDWST